ncbi:hypothetical protein ACFV1W_38120 [Kitasatospora sp. NPDC059648]|uniref:hypothetical protein n=1 Tax=Kitasatospora sp. NPDC059648 TaxID=3346894 RepID=UPI0036A4F00B
MRTGPRPLRPGANSPADRPCPGPAAGRCGAGSSPGETAPAARPATAAPVSPRGETPPGGERLRDLVDQRLAQQQTAPRPAPAAPTPASPQQPAELPVPADPMHRRLPPSDVRVALDAGRFGDWWALAGWTVNPDVYLVTGEGHQVGWVERGLAGIGDRWVAVYEGYC